LRWLSDSIPGRQASPTPAEVPMSRTRGGSPTKTNADDRHQHQSRTLEQPPTAEGDFVQRPGIDAVAGAWSETHPHRGGGSLRPEPLCGFDERRAEVMAFHAQFGEVQPGPAQILRESAVHPNHHPHRRYSKQW